MGLPSPLHNTLSTFVCPLPAFRFVLSPYLLPPTLLQATSISLILLMGTCQAPPMQGADLFDLQATIFFASTNPMYGPVWEAESWLSHGP